MNGAARLSRLVWNNEAQPQFYPVILPDLAWSDILSQSTRLDTRRLGCKSSTSQGMAHASRCNSS